VGYRPPESKRVNYMKPLSVKRRDNRGVSCNVSVHGFNDVGASGRGGQIELLIQGE
jgi:hypothetical protein